MSKWIEKELGELLLEKPKSRFNVADATGFGEYPFFTSGNDVLVHSEKIVEGENLFLNDGGFFDVKYYDGAAAYSNHTYVVSTNKNIDCKYVFYYLQSVSEVINGNYFQGTGLKNLRKDELKEHKFNLPEDIEEQKRIAAVLTKADELIESTQKLIDKQKNIKTGLMQTLLTCGIDENGVIRSHKTHKFKDSELGPIPEEWEWVELGKCCTKVTDGKHGGCTIVIGSGYFFVGATELFDGEIHYDLAPEINRDEFLKDYTRCDVSKGDLLLVNTGATIGKNCIAIDEKSEKTLLQKSVALIRTKQKVLSSYFLKYLYDYWKYMSAVDGASAQPNLLLSQIRKTIIYKPLLTEQDRIVEVLQQQDKVIKDLESEKQKYIDIKKGLMADLLSGKVKVSA